MLEFLIAVIPLLLLVVCLLLGRYPGCDTAMRLAERIASRARSLATKARSWRRPPSLASHITRGGLLLAFALSGRAPPA